jgi:hypothetical protein
MACGPVMATGEQAQKVPLATLPNPSTAVTSGVQLVTDGGSAELRFEFDRDGAIFRSGVILRTSVLSMACARAIAPRGTPRTRTTPLSR